MRAAALQKYISYIQAIRISTAFLSMLKICVVCPTKFRVFRTSVFLVHVVLMFYAKGALKFKCPPPVFQGIDPLVM